VRRDPDTVVVLVSGDVELASWTLRRGGCLDLAAVDHLARLQVAANRLGCSVRLRSPAPGLLELLDLVGLADVVVGDDVGGSGQAGREAEGGEQPGVEEVVVADDPVA